MMKYQVVIQPPAQEDIEAAYLYILERAPAAADKWLSGLENSIQKLERFPTRCGIARESDEFKEDIRQQLYGKRKGIYRILFVIRGETVHVLHVRHSARDAFSRDELGL
ncbi:MAG TPA: type II toxin-antitoxin system RelE/ParE family toxin [Tepidisphaeraceae bacterium]|jgi:plasmid stabilization system protein ParE|nr:type II toxin-antitoxin system RelE/ParE family toxin [Tepidisphaeraceae bacterium]